MPPGPVSVSRRTSARAEQVGDRCQLALAPDQRRRLDGQVRRPVLERPQRRELVRQPGDHELGEPLRARQVLEPVLAEVAQRDAVGQARPRPARASTARAAPGRRAPAAQIRAARGTSSPTYPVASRRLAGVEPDPHRTAASRSSSRCSRAAQVDGAGRARERGEERVALRVHLVSVRVGDRGSTRRWCSASNAA